MQELKNKDAAVVVFSGGQDSTTCLFWALKRYKKVIALSFDYHQKHVKELECAKKICRDHEVEHHIMDMSLLNQLAPNSLTRVDIKVDESAPEEGTPNSFVDGRNLLFLSYAAVFAKQTYASQTFEMTKLMSALIMLCLLSCVLYQAVGMLEKQFLKQ